MILRPQITWRKETALWAVCLAVVLLLIGPLIFKGVIAVKDQRQFQKPSCWTANASQAVLGQTRLDLNALAEAYSVDEVDNVRWSLVRRTPAADQVYRPESGVDWLALRGLRQSGTILVPAGFAWSFNETFQRGPGYKQAGGILAGGQCALATVFRAAAVQAGLPSMARPHAQPIPGFSREDAVNIYWGRDDLVVRNTTGQDLYFVWTVSPDEVAVSVRPISTNTPLPYLPDWREVTVAMVYGRPGTGGWGSLSAAATVDEALYLARSYGERVDNWNGDRPVAMAINPNVALLGEVIDEDLYLFNLIAEARRQGFYVMLDVQTGGQAPLPLSTALMDKYLQENVWFDWDIEHTQGQVNSAQINQVAAAYFARRQAQGYETPGVFGFYIFDEDQIINPADVRRQYDGGVVVPIFDGFGGQGKNPARDKIAKTDRVLSLFGDGPYGIMEFETRWGRKYDQISAQSYFAAFPNTLIMVSQ